MKLIRGGLVKTMAYGDIENGQILIDGNKIAAVGTELAVPENTEVPLINHSPEEKFASPAIL